MPIHDDSLSPYQAACIATNAYFTLKGWANYVDKKKAPKLAPGMESTDVIQDRVLGSGLKGRNQALYNPSLQGTAMASASLGNIHQGTSGAGQGVSSGFGYTMTYKEANKTHVIVAVRGTRPEMGGQMVAPDLLSDGIGKFAGFENIGPVHLGFKRIYESIMPSLKRDESLIQSADVVHFVGHSMGGAVATLLASHYAPSCKQAKLYTFGCPRVGAFTSYMGLEAMLGTKNIYRVAHDLDPVTMIGPFPYIHVHPGPKSLNFMTLTSPSRNVLSTTNHDMNMYLKTVERKSWENLVKASGEVDQSNGVLARVLLHGSENPGWIEVLSAKSLSMLFQLFEYALGGISTVLLLSLSAIDLLAEIRQRCLYNFGLLGAEIGKLLRYSAKWAGIQVSAGANFTASMIKAIFDKMMLVLKQMAMVAVTRPTTIAGPMRLVLPATWALTGCAGL